MVAYAQAGAPVGTGPKFAVDNDGTGDWPYNKLAFGPDGTQTIVSNANPLPVSATSAGVGITGPGALATGAVLKAGAGNLYNFLVTGMSADGWVLLFDSPTRPVDHAGVPIRAYPLFAGGYISDNFTTPLACSAGIYIALSSTGPYDLTTAPDGAIFGQVA